MSRWPAVLCLFDQNVHARMRVCRCALTLWTAASLCSLQLKSSGAPLLFPLSPAFPAFLALPGHFVDRAVLGAAGRYRRGIGRHAAHRDPPPVGCTSDAGYVGPEAAELQRRNSYLLLFLVVYTEIDLCLCSCFLGFATTADFSSSHPASLSCTTEIAGFPSIHT